MARVLDYQFNNIVTELAGSRTIKNAGTSGVTNDVTMDTGQKFWSNGADVYIDTGIEIDENCKTWIFIIHAPNGALSPKGIGCYDIDMRFYCISDGTNWRIGYGTANIVTSIPVTKESFFVVTNDGSITSIYVDGVFHTSFSSSFPVGAIPNKMHLGAYISDIGALYNMDGTVSNVAVLTTGATLSDAEYLFSNPEALVNVALGQTDANLSFVTADIKSLFPCNNGQQIFVNDIRTSFTASIVNYTSSVWTNGDLLEDGLQNTLLKKDINGLTTGISNTGTLRFNP